MKRRLGKFYPTFSFVEQGGMAPILSKMAFVPLRVEALPYRGAYEFVGTSPLFEEVDAAEAVPEYTLEITRRENGEVEVAVRALND